MSRRNRKSEDRPAPRDSKRTHRAKSATIARKSERRAKRESQGR